MLRAVARIGAPLAVGAYAVAYHFRPRDSSHEEFYKTANGDPERPREGLSGVMWRVAETVTLGFVGPLMSAIMSYGNSTEYLGKDRLARYATSDRDGRPLLTFANHHSCLDDPLVVAGIAPTSVMTLRNDRMRYNICTQEICFSHPATSTFFGTGHAWPVLRGGSIDQMAISWIQEKMNSGKWCHLFPEARTWQEHGSPKRDEQGRFCWGYLCGVPGSSVGPFKWGIGKVIANSEKRPIILPVFHMGMQKVLPQDAANNVISWWPKFGNPVTIKIGEPVEYEDILDAYFKAAEERAAARKVKHAASGRPLPEPGAGHRAAREEATQIWGYCPAVFAGEPAPDGSGRLYVPARASHKDLVVHEYVEEVLRAKPSDHDYLTAEEAIEEHHHRLQLYSDLAGRLEEALVVVEREVLLHRRERGIVDRFTKPGGEWLEDGQLPFDPDCYAGSTPISKTGRV